MQRISSNNSCATKWVLPFENVIIYQRGRGSVVRVLQILLKSYYAIYRHTHTKKIRTLLEGT